MCDHHDIITDARSAENICMMCGVVQEENLFYTDIYHTSNTSLKDDSKGDASKIDGEDSIVFLQKICDRLHLPESTIQNTFRKYKNTRKLINSRIALGQKNKNELISKKNLMVYSLYVRLKIEGVPRSLKDICSLGDVRTSTIIIIEKFLEQHHLSGGLRSKPLSAKNLIQSHYTYLDNFEFADLQVTMVWLDKLRFCSFSPATTAAGVTFLYLNERKKSKVSQSKIANLFQVTSVSIQRFLKRYKNDILS